MNFYLETVNKSHEDRVSALACLWGIEFTNIVIKNKYTKPFKENIFNSKVDFIVDVGTYCTMHDVMVKTLLWSLVEKLYHTIF